MPFSWILALVLFFAAAGAAGLTFVAKNRLGPAMAAIACAILGAVLTVIACYDRVDTRNVGIITEFGRPVDSRGAGIAWHAPWQKMSELSEAIQLQAFDGNNFDDPQSAIKVRLANNSAAYVEENLNWRIKEGAAPKLFQDYGGSSVNVFDQIKQNLVDRQAQVALAKVFATFNPQVVAVVDPNQPPTATPTPAQGADLPGMAAQVKKDLQDAVGTEIEILDVRIPGIFYDKATQERIDQYNQKVQETKNAQQDVKTAEQQKLASEARAAQAPPDLRIAIFNCIQKATEDKRDASGCWGQIGGQPLIQIPAPQR
jgi:hypothetical protein